MAFGESSFATRDVANQGLSLYMINIRSPTNKFLRTMTYVFGLSPQSVRKDVLPLNTIYDVAGDNPLGVQRMIDQYGQAPPVFTIQGTTGWKLHSGDGYVFSGKTSIDRIQALIKRFATLNQAQIRAQAKELYVMEFFDFWQNEFWEVIPIGPQTVQQNAQRPLLSDYSFRLAGTKNLADAITSAIGGAVDSLFGAGASSAISGVQNSVSSVLSKY